MIQLRKNEEIVLILHRHWIVIAEKIIIILILFAFPIIAVIFEEFIVSFFDGVVFSAEGGPASGGQPLFFFGLIIYWMILLGLLMLSWVEYWLDVWIITNERIIDIDQISLFHREISEFSLTRVQDVTVKIPNMLATLLKFGDITIQTAGERNFFIREVPNAEEAKDIILEHAGILRRKELPREE